ncbi:MAG: glycosyltransferase family 1 protein, partial [Microcystaceae cyanobacterium]
MGNQGKSHPLFISLIPNLMGGEGHIIPYHQAVAKSVASLGWEHLALMPTNSPGDLFLHQRSCLFEADLEAEGNAIAKLFRLKLVWQLATSMVKALGQQAEEHEARPTIIFMERFIHLQLLALAIAIWRVPIDNLYVWILYRRDVHQDKTRFFYKMLNRLIRGGLVPQHLRFLTDSEPLKVALSAYFKEEIVVMPIPHTDIDFTVLEKKPGSQLPIICWWAGSPREEKGWELMRKLTQTPINQGEKICIVAAKSSQLVPHP